MNEENRCLLKEIPEKLRVFISSAQKEENGFAWLDVRKRIKQKLSYCACLNPFIIEEVASLMPSTQLYKRQVECSDLVIVLVKGEVRPGTLVESSLAIDLHKPMLVYFLEETNPADSVKEFKSRIESKDYCTYCSVDCFDAIEDRIWKDIMSNMVMVFQDKYRLPHAETDSSTITLPKEINNSDTSGILTKVSIGKFNSAYYMLFDSLGLKSSQKEQKKSELDSVGISLIRWLCSGKWTVKESEIRSIVQEGATVFRNSIWLEKRWNAIKYYMRGDLEKAFSEEKSALKSAREAKESDWIIENILIDCRNMEISVETSLNHHVMQGEYQKELNQQQTFVYLPISDRYLNNIYDYIAKDEFTAKTASPYTEIYGSNLPEALTNLANYLFTVALYGSYTHLITTRKILAYIADHYSSITTFPALANEAIRQHLLFDGPNDFKLYLDNVWDNQYAYIASQANELWRLTDYVLITSRESMKFLVFSYLGRYLTDDIFKEAEEYICKCSNYIHRGNSELYFGAILENLNRMNANRVIRAIIPIIAEERYSVANKISNIFFRLEMKKISEKNQCKLAEVLKEQYTTLIRVNGDPQMLAPLINQNKEIFGDLEQISENELDGFQKALYRINTGDEDWIPAFKEALDLARYQFEENKQEGIYHGFLLNPYHVISRIIRKKLEEKNLKQIIIQELIPLMTEVLTSKAAVQVKEPCTACLCEVIGFLKKGRQKIPSLLKQALQNVDVNQGTDFSQSGLRRTLAARILTAKIMAGLEKTNGLFEWCYNFGNLETKEKIGIIDCLERYLYYHREPFAKEDPLLLSIVLQCSAEENPTTRGIAVRCLAYMLSNNPKDETIQTAINRTVYDPSNQVRMTLLNLCKASYLPKDISVHILNLLKNDANYDIRSIARRRR